MFKILAFFGIFSLINLGAVTKPHLVISSSNSLIDEPISIKVENLIPGQKIKIRATAIDNANEVWVSEAVFRSTKSILSLNDEAPENGSYEGIDEMGLFWSMKPETNRLATFAYSSDPIPFHFRLFINEKEVDCTTIFRSWSLFGVEKIIIREEGLVGTLFLPTFREKPPVILTLSGSQGGVQENRAELLAAHGFAVLTLAYFNLENLPPTLEYIPIEYFQKALSWIKQHHKLNGNKIGILGASKGGELVLILGTLFPESVQAIVAIVPSCAVYPGCAEKDIQPGWTYKGRPLEPIAYMDHVEHEKGLTSDDPIWLTSYFYKGIDLCPDLFCRARIPVEKIRCPMMLVSAGDDQMWPSAFFADRVEENANCECIHLKYPMAGHQLGQPYVPAPSLISWHHITKRWYYMGGSEKENELAKRDYWPKMIEFLKNNLN